MKTWKPIILIVTLLLVVLPLIVACDAQNNPIIPTPTPPLPTATDVIMQYESHMWEVYLIHDNGDVETKGTINYENKIGLPINNDDSKLNMLPQWYDKGDIEFITYINLATMSDLRVHCHHQGRCIVDIIGGHNPNVPHYYENLIDISSIGGHNNTVVGLTPGEYTLKVRYNVQDYPTRYLNFWWTIKPSSP